VAVTAKARRPLAGRPPADTHPHVQVADAAAARVRRQWLDLLTDLGHRFDVGDAAHLAAFTTPAIVAAVTAPELPVAKKIPTVSELASSLADVAARVARRVLGGPTIERASTIGFDASFALVRDQSVDWARQRTGELVAGIDRETRLMVAELVARGQQGELTVDEIARQIRPLIGLTPAQAGAAWHYRDALAALQLSDRLGRDAAAVLRNRYTLSPWRGGPLDGRVDKLWRQYIDRQMRWRAESIARTETIRAASAGDMLAWQERVNSGGADGYMVQREWSVTRDDRACPVCLALGGTKLQTVGRPGVDLRSAGTFDGVDHPPAHPQCRCVIVTTLEPADIHQF
jgi:hypothetical protein